MEKKITVSIIRHDEMDAFGAYGAKSIHSPEGGIILLNVDATFNAAAEYNLDAKNLMIETLAHEFAHALEEALGLEFDEERVESIVNSYRAKAIESGRWKDEEIEGGTQLPTPEDVKRWYELLVGKGEVAMYDNMLGVDRNMKV